VPESRFMVKPCIVCGGREFRYWATRKGIDVVICTQCGHGRSELPETYATDIEEHYDDGYYHAMSYDRRWRFRVGRATRWLRYVAEIKPPPGNMLDIGCSMGYYLAAARRLGWTPYGTDISRHALKVANAHGAGTFWSLHPDGFPDWLPPLDVVTAAQVIEHLHDPIDYLSALRGHMVSGGVIYVQVPNFQKLLRQGPEKPYMGPPEHAQFFTIETIRRTMEKAGWEVVQYPKLRPSTIGPKLWQWLPELVFEYPRELTREANTRNGRLSNMHIMARAPQ